MRLKTLEKNLAISFSSPFTAMVAPGFSGLQNKMKIISALVEMFMVSSREPIVAQQYLPDVRQGDKRVILV